MRIASRIVLCLALVVCVSFPAFAAVRVHWFPFDETPGAGGPGWTMSGGQWQYGSPGGLGGDPASAHTGDYVYGYDLTYDGQYENNMSATSLETTALDCTGYVNVKLRFWRWLGVEGYAMDRAYIWVSNDGTLWYEVWRNPAGTTNDGGWTQVEYDISDWADNESTVYVAWRLGPADGSNTYCGWNIDDVEILGDPATKILAWVPYSDMAVGGEYEHTFDAISTYYDRYTVTSSTTTSAATLESELAGMDVFLAVEQESASTAQLEAAGTEFSAVLTDFVEAGGTVVVCAESHWVETGFLNSTGLMSALATEYNWGETQTVMDASHPIMEKVSATFTGADATVSYSVGTEATVLVEDPDGDTVVAVRQIGAGAVVLVGFDYYAYGNDEARILANAVQYPRATGEILLYDVDDTFGGIVDQHIAQQALDEIGYSYTTADGSTFNDELLSQPWELVVVDAPNAKPAWGDLIDYMGDGGRAIISTWSLTGEAELCAAFGVSSAETLGTLPTIYPWQPTHPVYTTPNAVGNLSGWLHQWVNEADRLSYVSGDVVALAGFTASSTADQAAIVLTDGRRILNGFLWDEADQDTDTDSVDDTVELVMNQISYLLPYPWTQPDFSASTTTPLTGESVDFTDLSDASCVTWYWQFGDGATSTDQNPSHTYTSAGSYTVTLTASNPDGQDTVTKTSYISVSLPPPPTAGFTGTPLTGVVDLSVSFTDSSTDGPTSWSWDFGDTGTATTQNPTHLYTEPGKYTVSLTATNAYGSDTETKTAYVKVGFPDTAPDLWAFEEILDCVDAEIVGGYEDGNYYPGLAVDRAQMAAYVARMLAGGDSSVPAGPATATFNDVPTDFWAYDYVEYCVGEDIVQGYDAVTYAPANIVTRDQMAVYIGRSIAGGDALVPGGPGTATFDDVPTDYWAFKYVEYCVANSVVQGYDATTYAPDVQVTRDQMAVYVSRALPLI